MRAMLLENAGPIASAPLRNVEVEPPDPGNGDLVLEVSACAVCRTDLQLCEGAIPQHLRPVIPGHQVVGRVRTVGSGVSGWKLGDRAGVAWLGAACGACARCLEHRENLCERARFTGWDTHGGYATHIAVRADFALAIPERFTDADAAPLLCGGIIGYRSLKLSGIRPGGRLGLYGFGASASLAIQVARHWGCEVFVVTRKEREQARAKELGAVWSGGADRPVPARLDAAVTFAPIGDAVVAALRALDRGATVAVNAIHLDRVPEFSYDLLWGERSVRSVANFTREDAREFLELAAKIPIVPHVERFALEDANRALERVARGTVDGTPVLEPR